MKTETDKKNNKKKITKLRKEMAELYKKYTKMPNGPDREKLWRKDRALLEEIHGLEQHLSFLDDFLK